MDNNTAYELASQPLEWPYTEEGPERDAQARAWLELEAPISRRYAAHMLGDLDFMEVWDFRLPGAQFLDRLMSEGLTVWQEAPAHLQTSIKDLTAALFEKVMKALFMWVLDHGMTREELSVLIESSIAKVYERKSNQDK